jgi:acyl dehydratase
VSETLIGPITAQWIAAYAAASGDDNPLHTVDNAERPAIVHGALLAALAERYALGALPTVKILSMRFKFLGPVRAGESIAFSLGQGRTLERGGKRITEQRITARIPGRRPCILAECTYEDAEH